MHLFPAGKTPPPAGGKALTGDGNGERGPVISSKYVFYFWSFIQYSLFFAVLGFATQPL